MLLCIFLPCSALALGSDERTSRDKGVILFRQSAWDSAQPFLKIAAEAGDPTAQYYLAETIRLNHMYMTAEAEKWYEAAALQGHIYAMLRLSNKGDLCRTIGTCGGTSGDEWRARVLKMAHERANSGDTEAMAVLYTIGEGLSWLEKAAESGDNDAQHFLAIAYKKGEGWFILPGSRHRAVERWAKASAEGGFAPAMTFYANFLYDNQRDMTQVGYWVKKAADAGHLEALGSYARYVAHSPDGLGYTFNLIEAYGITYLISKLTGGGIAPKEARSFLPKIADNMSPEEIQQGIAYAEEWEKNHPPLSYYPPIYGY